MTGAEEVGKLAWVVELPGGQPAAESLARLVEQDHDAAETDYYEAAADPQVAQIETDRRRYRGQYLRRLRRHRSTS